MKMCKSRFNRPGRANFWKSTNAELEEPMFGLVQKHRPSPNTITSISLLLLEKVPKGRMRLRGKEGEAGK